MTDTPALRRLSVLMSFSGAGGVERMMVNLLSEMAKQLEQIDLLLLRDNSPHLQSLPDNVRLIKLRSKHSLTAIPELSRYLKREQPQALLVAKDRAGRAAVRARSLAGTQTPIYIRLGTNLSAALQNKSALSAWFRTAPMRRLYAKVNKVIAVSEGVRQDTIAVTGLPADRVTVIRNPVITEQLLQNAQAPVPHPWLEDKSIPVVIGAGRLSQQKDFATLINAFALLQKKQQVKLIILGEGGLRPQLAQQIQDLGLQDCVLLPGFQKNPQCWVARANLFVLSSRWEGSPNVLSEALALGVPCVATRCPSGPNEVLAEGRYGPLVAMGDAEGMSKAMQQTLAAPLPGDEIKQAVDEYRAPLSAQRYLQLLASGA